MSDETVEQLNILLKRVDALKNKFEAHNWKNKHQKEIDALGEDKGVLMTKYFEKIRGFENERSQ